ncbi:MAG: glycosyltransferase [Anaerolineae bacterium]|nr:glycosyltransferase [Chloroflexota bacterium]
MSTPYLTVLIPCYNERENLQRGVLDEVHDYLSRQAYSWEVIVSDDGSSDDSRELVRAAIADKPGFRLQENPHGGKPSALWLGLGSARGEITLFTDMDQSTPIHQVARLLPCFEQGFDAAIGSRGVERQDFVWYRRLGSAVFRALRRALLLRNISDTQCGFKAIRTPLAREVFARLEPIRNPVSVSGWRVTAFDVELLYLLERGGHRIAEVPVEWADRDAARGKQKSYLAESKEMLGQILRVKRNAWRGEYDRPSR